MVKKTQTSKRHHYVPRGYLKGFSKDEKFIHVTPLDLSRTGYKASVDKVGLVNEYNTMIYPAIFERADEAEHQLSKIEAKAIPIIRRIENREWKFSEQEREDLSRFIAIQAHRGPEVRERHEKFLDHLAMHTDKMTEPEDLRELVESYPDSNYPYFDFEAVWENLQCPDFDLKENLKLQHLQNTFISAEIEIASIACRKWSFVYFNRKALITSDSPVGIFAPEGPITEFNTTLYGASALLFPLSRKVALHMGDLYAFDPRATQSVIGQQMAMTRRVLEGQLDVELSGTTFLAKKFNTLTACFAEKNIFRHPDDIELDSVITSPSSLGMQPE